MHPPLPYALSQVQLFFSVTNKPKVGANSQGKKELGFLLQEEVHAESSPKATGKDSGEIGDKLAFYPVGNPSSS